MTSMTKTHDIEPAFDGLPSGTDIAHWFTEVKRGESNVGGDAWWLSRDPHSSCRMLAFVDLDTQEWYLLDIATGDTKDLLLVSCGLDGLWAEWWQHPVSTSNGDPYWTHDGVDWLAERIVLDHEQRHGIGEMGDYRAPYRHAQIASPHRQ